MEGKGGEVGGGGKRRGQIVTQVEGEEGLRGEGMVGCDDLLEMNA